MQWRRGVLLAGINLVAALAPILMLEARDAQEVRDREQSTLVTIGSPMLNNTGLHERHSAKLLTVQEEETVTFNPCSAVSVHYPVQNRVVWSGNFPAAALAGWRVICPSSWSLSELLMGKGNFGLTRAGLASQRRVDAGFCALIAVQWLLVGAFPLRKPKRWWGEPGAFITACTLLAAGSSLIHAVEDVALIPATAAACAWLWWFGLLVWLALRFCWRKIAGMFPAHAR